jgi:hypothetical protein
VVKLRLSAKRQDWRVIVFAQHHAVLVSESVPKNSRYCFGASDWTICSKARIAAEPVLKVASVPTYQSSGLARMERANPISRSDARCRRSFYRPGSRVAVPTPVPVAPAPRIWLVQIFCAPGPTYMLKLGPSVLHAPIMWNYGGYQEHIYNDVF